MEGRRNRVGGTVEREDDEDADAEGRGEEGDLDRGEVAFGVEMAHWDRGGGRGRREADEVVRWTVQAG